MKVKLKSINTDHYSPIEKTLIFVPRENEVVIVTEDGKEIASLDICIMDKEVETNGVYKIEPSNSYWVQFKPKSCQTHEASADIFEKDSV